jgi:hypothetical protein
MRGCLAGADNAADFLPRFRVWLRPCVDNEQHHCPNQPYSLPAIPVRMGVKAADGKLIVKNKLCGLEAEAMISLIGSVFLILPNPPHAILTSQIVM